MDATARRKQRAGGETWTDRLRRGDVEALREQVIAWLDEATDEAIYGGDCSRVFDWLAILETAVKDSGAGSLEGTPGTLASHLEFGEWPVLRGKDETFRREWIAPADYFHEIREQILNASHGQIGEYFEQGSTRFAAWVEQE